MWVHGRYIKECFDDNYKTQMTHLLIKYQIFPSDKAQFMYYDLVAKTEEAIHASDDLVAKLKPIIHASDDLVAKIYAIIHV